MTPFTLLFLPELSVLDVNPLPLLNTHLSSRLLFQTNHLRRPTEIRFTDIMPGIFTWYAIQPLPHDTTRFTFTFRFSRMIF